MKGGADFYLVPISLWPWEIWVRGYANFDTLFAVYLVEVHFENSSLSCSFIDKLRLTLLGARENLHFIEFHKNNLHQYKIGVNTKELMTSTLNLRSVGSFKVISLVFVRHIHSNR